MKKHVLGMLTVLGIGGLLAVPCLYAQSYGSPSLMATATIPFKFHVSEKVLPAGDYTVSRHAQSVILIRSADNRDDTFVVTYPTQAAAVPAEGKLVFNCYEGRCFLSKIWSAGSPDGQALPKSKAEIETARNGLMPKHVQVALIRR